MKEQLVHDKRLRELVRKSGISQPQETFTDKVMERIHKEPVPEIPLVQTFFTRQRLIWLILTALAVVVVVVFLISWSPFDLSPENMNLQQFEKLIPYFQSTVAGLSKFFNFLTGSSLPLIIGIGIVILIGIDRILRRLTLNRSMLF